MSSSSSLPPLPDSLHVPNLSLRLPLGIDSWSRPSPSQPIFVDVQVHTDVTAAGVADHLPHSIHYGLLVKDIEAHAARVASEAAAEGEGGDLPKYRSLEELADGLAKLVLFKSGAHKVTLRCTKTRALLHAESVSVEVVRERADYMRAGAANGHAAGVGETEWEALQLSPQSRNAREDKLIIKNLTLSTILGVNATERVDKQLVKLNLTLLRPAAATLPSSPSTASPRNYRTLARAVTAFVEQSSYQTVESLALGVAKVMLLHDGEGTEKVWARVDKPSAIMFADAAGCEVVRGREWLREEAKETEKMPTATATTVNGAAPTIAPAAPSAAASTSASATPSSSSSREHLVALSLGSNLGTRSSHINHALRLLSAHPSITLIDTSFLYETQPMYYEAQPLFLNAAARISTTLGPLELLEVTQGVELKVGRAPKTSAEGKVVKGPRIVDVDILLYDNQLVSHGERLQVPHKGMPEREFVLRPLCDVLPDWVHPRTGRSVREMLDVLTKAVDYDAGGDVKRVMPPCSPRQQGEGEESMWTWRGDRTLLMGILNATPDSFSDGGDNLSVDSAVQNARRMVEEGGVDVLDVGGMSTAPGAADVSEEEELARVVPIIKALRRDEVVSKARTPISIDTFRASVAKAALDAGADIINDVTAGRGDAAMLSLAAERGVPVILMHSRGDAATMNKLAKYDAQEGGVVAGVRRELQESVEAALRAGVRRWNIILDPGIGFAKDCEGNLELLKGLSELVAPQNRASGGDGPRCQLDDFPLLVGPSRKRFVGTLVGEGRQRGATAGSGSEAVSVPAKERAWGTAAAISACVASGVVDVVRVHDVKEMRDVLSVADGIYRGRRVMK